MANIGLRKFYYAPVLEADGTDVTDEDIETAKSFGTLLYDTESAGVGSIGGARRCQVTYQKADGQLYGDDKMAEKWELTLGADIEMEWAPRSGDELKVIALGVETYDWTAAKFKLATENQTAVGFGFIQVRIINGVKTYRAIKFHKVIFHIETEETQTKEERIEWGCPILKGHAFPVELFNADAGEVRQEIREYADFSSASEAESWLSNRFPYTQENTKDAFNARLFSFDVDGESFYDLTSGLMEVSRVGTTQSSPSGHNVYIMAGSNQSNRHTVTFVFGLGTGTTAGSGAELHTNVTDPEIITLANEAIARTGASAVIERGPYTYDDGYWEYRLSNTTVVTVACYIDGVLSRTFCVKYTYTIYYGVMEELVEDDDVAVETAG